MAVLQAMVLSSTFCIALNDVPDEGTVALQALRVLQGQLGHRDYFIQTPLSGDYWVAAWFSVFGSSLESLRLYFITEMALLVACLQWTSAQLLRRGWSELPALAFLCNAPFCWYIASPRWDACLWIMLALSQVNSGRRWWLTGAGVGLAALTQHPAGAAACAGIGLAMLLQPKPTWQEIRLFAGGVLLFWFPYVLFLASQGLVSNFLYDTIFFNLTNYVSPVPYDWRAFGDNFRASWGLFAHGEFWPGLLTLGYACTDVSTYGCWFLTILLGLALALRERRVLPLAITLTLLFLTLLEIMRPNRYHFNFHLPLVLMVMAYIGSRCGRLGVGAAVVFLAAHALVLLGHRTSNASHNQPVSLPNGTLYLRSPGRAEALRRIAEVNASIPAREKMFVFPDDPSVQWLLGRGPTTREVAAAVCFYTFTQFQAIRQSLDEEKVENLLFIPLAFSPDSYPAVTARQFQEQQEWLVEYFTTNYTLTTSVVGVSFYRRKVLP